MNILYTSELYHHGIRGQRWGFRRFQNKDGSLTRKGEQRYYGPDDSKKISRKERKKIAKSIGPDSAIKKKSLKTMSDEELKSAVTRLGFESKYNEYMDKRKQKTMSSKAKAFAKDVLDRPVKNVLSGVSENVLGSLVDSALGSIGYKNATRKIIDKDGNISFEEYYKDIFKDTKDVFDFRSNTNDKKSDTSKNEQKSSSKKENKNKESKQKENKQPSHKEVSDVINNYYNIKVDDLPDYNSTSFDNNSYYYDSNINF